MNNRNTYHDRHFARSTREAFGPGQDFHTYENADDKAERRAIWITVALFVAFVAFVAWLDHAEAAPRYAQAPDQQRVVVEQHYQQGGMR